MNKVDNNIIKSKDAKASLGELACMLPPALTSECTSSSSEIKLDDFDRTGHKFQPGSITNTTLNDLGRQAKKQPFLIGVSGGTASGKTSVCKKVQEMVIENEVGSELKMITLCQDSFYKEFTPSERELVKQGLYNFDHPDAFDHELMLSCLKDIREGKTTKIPHYDFITHSRIKDKFTRIEPSDVVLVEGILVFYDKAMLDMFDMKLFVDTDADTRLARRVSRDIKERGRDLEGVLQQYCKFVKPAFEVFCLPTKKHADIIIPRGKENIVAISMVARFIKDTIYKQNKCNNCNEISDNSNL